jgi:outer membrane protein assembly factor BamA
VRHIPDGKYLVRKNLITYIGKKPEVEDISNYIKQKPNKKFLGLYIRLGIYNVYSQGKTTKFRERIKTNLGEEPVVLDTNITNNSLKQIKLYLNNKGYFNSQIEKKIDTNIARPSYKKLRESFSKTGYFNTKTSKNQELLFNEIIAITDRVYLRKRKADVHYIIKPAAPYKIRNISFYTSQQVLLQVLEDAKKESYLKSGNRYDADILDKERDRLTKIMKNEGYYYFTKDFIRYDIDSTLNSHQLDIKLNITEPYVRYPLKPDSLVMSVHKKFKINKIYIFTDYTPVNVDTAKYDTLAFSVPYRKKNSTPFEYIFIYKKKMKIRPKTYTQSLYVTAGELYNYENVDKTYKRLLGLKVFRYTNISFEDISDFKSDTGLLNCKIFLTRSPAKAFSVETEGTNSGGELGLSANLVYENKNLLKGAELFRFAINGAMENQRINVSSTTVNKALKNLKWFNTIETGADLSLKIPRFLIPARQELFPRNFKPKTTIDGSFNLQIRPDYTRYIYKGSWGYEWKESEFKTHIVTPFNVNIVKIYPDSLFQRMIDSLQDPILQNMYSDHIITALTYSFIYNNQNIEKTSDFMYFRGDVELAGFVFLGYTAIINEVGNYLLFNMPYSQYFRLNADYRYYHFFKPKNSLVFHTNIGYGMPLTKYNSLPFEKAFYVGGANSMRGWQLKSLGPGGFCDSTSYQFDKVGDINIEVNLEYRFPIYKIFRGALFVDAGNIWLQNSNDDFPDAEFRFDKFYRQIALDAGAGIRLDFGFFMFRFDAAMPISDPSEAPGKRWIFDKSDPVRKVQWHIAIGYPF